MSKEKGFCDVCGTEIEVTSCSSFDCGCMGLPTEPPIVLKNVMIHLWAKNIKTIKKLKALLYSLNQKRYKNSESSFGYKVAQAGI